MTEHGHAEAAHAGHHSPEEVAKHVKVYYMVFAALAVLTVVTVLVAKLHVAHGVAIAIALAVASVKASLVAAFFMHLKGERSVIWWCLALTAAFFLVLMTVPSFTDVETRIQ